MEVISLLPHGFCQGVVRAIKDAIKVREENPNLKIGVLGMIVHNSYVVNLLNDYNIKSYNYNFNNVHEVIETIEDDIVILTAHGTRSDIVEHLNKKGIKIVDTTCSYVINTYKLIKEELKNNHEVIYLGVKDHPEAEFSKGANPNKVHLLTSTDDVKALDLTDESPLLVNQTTISMNKINELTSLIIKKYPKSRFSNEQCDATRRRQEAVLNMPKDCDIAFIIGDKKSNNTRELYLLAKQIIEDSYMISSLDKLDINLLKNKKKAALTSGASTPETLFKEIFNFLNQFNEEDISTHDKSKFFINGIKIL